MSCCRDLESGIICRILVIHIHAVFTLRKTNEQIENNEPQSSNEVYMMP